MYEVVWVFFRLLATFAFMSASKSTGAAPTSLTSPVIVGQVAVADNVPIATTTFFTAQTTGLYRISAYLAMRKTGNTGCPWNLALGWTDDAGAEGPQQILQVSDKQKPPNAYSFGPTAGYQ